MTLHDVDIGSLRQWWRRAKRAGHGIAELVAIHGRGADSGWNRFLSSAYVWSAIMLLALALLLASVIQASPLLLAAAITMAMLVCVQIVRTGWRARNEFALLGQAMKWGALLLLSKLAQSQGAFLYWRRRLTSSHRAIIEYK